jgi:eukaryotic-like serine/threonine-protein kinase
MTANGATTDPQAHAETGAAHATAPPSDETIAIRQLLAPRYLVEHELGRGGMGVVYLATDGALDRLVAIKVLPATLAAVPEMRERFLRETRMAAGLSHPNIVPVFAVEERAELVYFVMGFVDGETLTERVRRVGRLPSADVARLLQEVAWALSYAHGRGVVHRDVKPDNILVERGTARAFITDFGIARAAGVATMTRLGEVMGTPHYMSPEQAMGETVDGRSDLYSLGVVGYFAVTGVPPFEADSVQALVAMQVSRLATPLTARRPDVPPRLAAAVDRCLAKDPAARFPSGEALAEALRDVHGGALETAAPVRAFHHAAEMGLAQLLTLVITLPILFLARLLGVIVLLVPMLAFAATLIVQLVGQVRALLAQGFDYEDVRAHALAERAVAGRGDVAADHPGAEGRARTTRLVGAGIAFAGIALGATSAPDSSLKRIAWAAVYTGAIVLLAGLVQAGQRGGAGQRIAHAASAFWIGGLGRRLFALVQRVVLRDRAALSAGAPRSAALLMDTLPAAARTRLAPWRPEVQQLERGVRELERRQQVAAAALAEDAAAPALTAIEPSDSTVTALRSRHDLLVERFRAEQKEFAVMHDAIMGVLANLRFHLVHMATGAPPWPQLDDDLAAVSAVVRRLEGLGITP